jgi:16S rRNA (adenine1518-N6/adenine1519-N6)-dimethyltransferase
VHAARRLSVRRVRDVPPGAFDPPPEVDSMVVALEPHAAPPFGVRDERVWRAVVDGTFQQRRKKLRNTLPGAVAALGVPREKALAAAAPWADRRPEELSPAEFAALADAVS